MKYNWKKLLLWFSIFFFIGGNLRDIIISGTADFLEVDSAVELLWIFNSFFTFFLFSLLTYTAMYYSFQTKNWIKLVALLLVALLLPIPLRFFLDQILSLHIFGRTNYNIDSTFISFGRDNMIFGFRYISLGIIYYFVTYNIKKDKIQKNLTIENQNSELALLKSQMNPHFLLNALNNIYSLVYHKSDDAPKALNQLSQLLKYSLYDKREFVPLSDELDYLEKYIDLHRFKYDFPLNIKMDINQSLMSINIPQFLIVPLIENIFKHADLKSKDRPPALSIQKDGSHLSISTSNKKGQFQKDDQQGIGLENIQKRMQLLYNSKHTFEIFDTKDQYKVDIKIPLNHD